MSEAHPPCPSPGYSQNMGQLGVLPREALQLALAQLKGREVRHVSRAMRSAFDGCNTRLVL